MDNKPDVYVQKRLDYEKYLKRVTEYEIGQYAKDVLVVPPLIQELLNKQANSNGGNRRLNIALFGFTGTGKSAAVSTLVNAAKDKNEIDLVSSTVL